MKFIDTNNLKKEILANCDQEIIMSKLLGVSEEEVAHCLKHTSNKIKNPLRDDKDASLGMMYDRDNQTRLPKLRIYDFADSFYRGDLFHVASIVFGLNSNNKHDFISICNLLLTIDTQTFSRAKQEHIFKERGMSTIQVSVRQWFTTDQHFWNAGGLPLHYIEDNRVSPVYTAYLNDRLIYTHKVTDPCYAYYYGVCPIHNKHIYKLYFPLRPKGVTRFITNNTYVFEDPLVHISNDILLLTKSYKDELSIKYQLLNNPVLRNEPITIKSVSSENANFKPVDADFLASRYKYIFTNFDFDRAGIRLAYKLKREYGYLPLFFTNGRFNTKAYGAKDFFAFYGLKGSISANNLMISTYNYITQTIIDNERLYLSQ